MVEEDFFMPLGMHAADAVKIALDNGEKHTQ